MQSEGPWCIVSQLRGVRSEETTSKGRMGGAGWGDTAVRVKKGPQDVYSWRQQGQCSGLYSVQMTRKRRTHLSKAGTGFTPQSLRESDRGAGGVAMGRHHSNSARENTGVPSMYSVHRVIPQWVLTNMAQLTTTLVCVFRRSPLSLLSPPPPFSLVPAHRHWNRPVFPGRIHIRMQWKANSLQTNRGHGWERAAREGGEGGGCRRASLVYNQVKSLWLCWYHRKERARRRVGRHVHTCTCSEGEIKIIKRQNRIVKLKVFKRGGVVYSYDKKVTVKEYNILK